MQHMKLSLVALSLIVFSHLQMQVVAFEGRVRRSSRSLSQHSGMDKKGLRGDKVVAYDEEVQGAVPRAIIKWHYLCAWPFPHLKPWTGNHGDMCVPPKPQTHNWHCPKDCEGVFGADSIAAAPWCLNKDTRDKCSKLDCSLTGWQAENHGPNPNVGNLCRSPYQRFQGMPPGGCTFSADPFNPPYYVTTGTSDPCRITANPHKALVGPIWEWVVVASKNGKGDLNAKLEIGFSSSSSSSNTKEESERFYTRVETSASATVVSPGFFGSADMNAVVEYEKNTRLASTVTSASQQEQVRTISVTCPGFKNYMTFLYQWEVREDNTALKSEHFRCHYSASGGPTAPQCPPFACGVVWKNPNCLATPKLPERVEGSDPECKLKRG